MEEHLGVLHGMWRLARIPAQGFPVDGLAPASAASPASPAACRTANTAAAV